MGGLHFENEDRIFTRSDVVDDVEINHGFSWVENLFCQVLVGKRDVTSGYISN